MSHWGAVWLCPGTSQLQRQSQIWRQIQTKTKSLRFISIYSIYSGGMVCQSVTEAEDLYYTGARGARSALAQSRSPQKDGWQDPSQETSVLIWNGPMSKWGSTSIEGCVQMFRCKQASGGLLKKCAGNIWIIHSPPFRKECPSPRKNTFPFGPCQNPPPLARNLEKISIVEVHVSSRMIPPKTATL